MVEAFLRGVFLEVCVKCFQEFLTGISLDSGLNFYFWAKQRQVGQKRKIKLTSSGCIQLRSSVLDVNFCFFRLT